MEEKKPIQREMTLDDLNKASGGKPEAYIQSLSEKYGVSTTLELNGLMTGRERQRYLELLLDW